MRAWEILDPPSTAERDDVWSTGTRRMRPAPLRFRRDTGRGHGKAPTESADADRAEAPDARHGRR